MSNTTNTPTPWHVVSGNLIKDELMPFDRDERDTVLIATTGPRAESELANANAGFIVRAVNSHYDLIALLEEAARYLRHDPQTCLELVGRIEAKTAELRAEA